MSDLKATVLIDNIGKDELCGEWGLAIYIEYRGHKILLDTGTTGVFADNAEKMGIDLSAVEYGVLSHAHYDHADGLDRFFELNQQARFYFRKGSGENCYDVRGEKEKYIGIKPGTMEKHADRLAYADGDYELLPGVTLIPHKTENLSEIGRKAHMFIWTEDGYKPDDFSHEQSLVFDTEKGLVIFNSCSHGGADNIINEIKATYPGKKIYAIMGGFHLFLSSTEDVYRLAEGILDTGITKVITGHCTGDKAFLELKEKLGDRLDQMYTGYVLEV